MRLLILTTILFSSLALAENIIRFDIPQPSEIKEYSDSDWSGGGGSFTTESGQIDEVCSIKFVNLDSTGNYEYDTYAGTIALANIKVFNQDDNVIDMGALHTNGVTSATFDNGSLSSTTAYINEDYYHPAYAISGYESTEIHKKYYLSPKNTSDGFFEITYNTAQTLSKIQFSNVAFKSPSSPYYRMTGSGFDIEVYDCESNLIRTVSHPEGVYNEISGTYLPNDSEVISIIF